MSTIKKQEPNYLVINFQNFSYDEKLVLPYKEGITFLSSLENARVYKSDYGNPGIVKEIDNKVQTMTIGAKEYNEAILRSTLLSETGN